MPAETIAAVATPPGVGALGILRLSGPRSLGVALSFLDREALEPRRATLAQASCGSTPVDQVVATYFPGPGSATGEDLLEITCHGSPYIMRKLLEAALKAGARLAEPGEFTQRAFLNGRLDLAQAEAVCSLIRARTELAHRSALVQLEGGLSQAVGSLREPILDLLVRIEASLDHPEEDIPSLPPEEVSSELGALRERILALAGSFEQGRLVSEGARICIVGRPNAGKSSLLNALLGFDRAIVSPTPGTTRDTLEEPASLSGIPGILIDTAGLRAECRDPAEAEGLLRAQRALRSSDMALLVVDGSRPLDAEDERVHRDILEAAAREGRPVLTVLSKSDLPGRTNGHPAQASVSALTREGLPDLVRLIAKRLSGSPPEIESRVLVTSLRHHEALRRSAAELEEGSALPALPQWEDRLACHLREALRQLGEILGEGTPEEVLRRIFSRFCIGK